MHNSFYFVIFMWLIFLYTIGRVQSREEGNFSHHSPSAIFVFGDSLSDTGNVIAAFPFFADAENSPYGSTFFHAPSGRYSDGRLIIDFMASRWGFPFVEPYSSNIVPNYRHGINFAVSGATAINVTRPIPFFLPLQTDHFIRFKRNVYRSLNSKHKSECLESRVPPLASFKDGMYMIFIGINDILDNFTVDGATPAEVMEKTVPQVISAIFKAVQDLHREGARNFMVFNVPAIGCTPLLLTLASSGAYNSTDGLGCLKEYNGVVEFANLELGKALNALHHQLEDITIMVADLYAFMLEAIANPTRYGFDKKVTLKACCGYGGDPYNYSPLVTCGGNPSAKSCSRPSEYMSWDGLHFTDAFSQRFVEVMMRGMPYLKPALSTVYC
ncbi:hypothetical protein MRB53_030000 [Persea americana]|uniref:Uncharacterized protein n=1 Tax=Persea americana TaxID=3435 RepID=A0ACC2KK86_PERAE|nr:hypothetical protein MRB53_030000 [Persea americana]